MIHEVEGDIAQIIQNDMNRYEGNLEYYFSLLFQLEAASHVNNPYHGVRHSLHVLWLCHDAIVFYERAVPVPPFSKRTARDLMIAALFHDWDHTGSTLNDRVNIMRALAAVDRHLLPEDKPHADSIKNLIRHTEFPYAVPSEKLPFAHSVLRDADRMQGLNPVWIQQVLFGLALETGISPLAMLRRQEPFLRDVKFATLWAQNLYPQHAIDAKIKEARRVLAILDRAIAPSLKQRR